MMVVEGFSDTDSDGVIPSGAALQAERGISRIAWARGIPAGESAGLRDDARERDNQAAVYG
jgi:hypothetical protein